MQFPARTERRAHRAAPAAVRRLVPLHPVRLPCRIPAGTATQYSTRCSSACVARLQSSPAGLPALRPWAGPATPRGLAPRPTARQLPAAVGRSPAPLPAEPTTCRTSPWCCSPARKRPPPTASGRTRAAGVPGHRWRHSHRARRRMRFSTRPALNRVDRAPVTLRRALAHRADNDDTPLVRHWSMTVMPMAERWRIWAAALPLTQRGWWLADDVNREHRETSTCEHPQ